MAPRHPSGRSHWDEMVHAREAGRVWYPPDVKTAEQRRRWAAAVKKQVEA